MLYILIFVVFSIFSILELNVESRTLKVNLAAMLALTTVLLIIMAGTRTIGFDYENYAYLYDVVNISNFLEHTVELGYAFVTEICQRLGFSFHGFLAIIALFAVGLKILFFYKWSENWFLSLTYYFAIGFTINEMGQIRQGLALAIVLWAFSDLFQNKDRGFFFKVFIAFLFHASALIVFPAYLLVKKKLSPIWIMLAVFPLMLFVVIDLKVFLGLIIDYLPLTHLQAKLGFYILSEEYGQRLGLNLSLVLRMVFLFLLYLYHDTGKKRYAYYDVLYKLYFFGLMLYMLFNSIADLAIRSSLYFKFLECLILPILVKLGRGRTERNVLMIVLILYSFWSLYKIVFDPAFSSSYLPYQSILFN